MNPDPGAFCVFECSLARCTSGRCCANLRELFDSVRSVSDSALEHHLIRCALDDHFELNEFPNDLARWCWDALGEQVLAEQIALIDPYQYATFADLRAAIAEAIEERLWTLQRVPWCRPGLELHWIESRLIAFDTGERIDSLPGLARAVSRMSSRSLFYHVHDAHRRNPERTDDFSHWLEQTEGASELVQSLRKIDFYFLNLNQLRGRLTTVLELASAHPLSGRTG